MNNHYVSILATSVLLLNAACRPNSEPQIETYTVKRGAFVLSVTETGELEAVHSQTISAPMIPWNLGGLKIAMLVEEGKEVAEGDVVADFVKTEVEKNLDDARANLDIALAEFRKAKAIQTSEIEELEANLKKSDLEYRIKQLEFEKTAFEADIERKGIELEVEKASISLEKADQEIENKKKVHRQELNKLELKVKQERTKVEEADETLAKLTLTAPAPGIVILKENWTTDKKVQVDDEVWRGQPLMGLPDLSLIQAIVPINEVDIAKMDTSQTAFIKLDAFPDTSFAGQVTEIAPLARNKEKDSKVKVFDVTVLLMESDTTLMPGMTVSCEIVADELADTLFIPLDALFRRDSETIVYVKKGDNFKPRVVKTGPDNDDHVVIIDGLAEGEEIALTDPQLVAFSSTSQKDKGQTDE